ncbi:MAG: T9SS type A sorting domain-containing protein [Candidatus Cloacimonetes bacterium]|nr:T9SS type A sorting domain-containing protein [Candidatus Cloacimonadota bacterium]
MKSNNKKVHLLFVLAFWIYPIFAQFAGGSGIIEDPWQIATAEHLNDIRNYLGEDNSEKYFIQIADINLGEAPWNVDSGWNPIGDLDTKFYGNFDGDNYSITNLTINKPNDSYIGIFGYIFHATLSNIILTDIDIIGRVFVGGLVGTSWFSEMENIHTSGTIEAVNGHIGGLIGANGYTTIYISSSNCNIYATGDYVGGFAGENSGYAIASSYATGSVTGESFVGGLIGWNSGGDIYDCFATGNVIGSDLHGYRSSVGGLVGENSHSSSIANSYSTGNVTGITRVGGLVGANFVTSSILKCYSIGSVVGESFIGGLLGAQEDSSTSNSYWNVETSGQTTSVDGEGLTSQEMVNMSNFNNWNFNNIWQIVEGITYPWLSWQNEPGEHNYYNSLLPPSNLLALTDFEQIHLTWNPPSLGIPLSYNIYRDNIFINNVSEPNYTDTNLINFVEYNYCVTASYEEGESFFSNAIKATPNTGFAGGIGTEESPFQISNAEQLNNVRYQFYNHFIQTENIDLGVEPWNSGTGWLSIGRYDDLDNSNIINFIGSYNGNNYTILNLTINMPDAHNVGLFSKAEGAMFKNIIIEDPMIIGDDDIAALLGYVYQSQIEFCSIKKVSEANISGRASIAGLVGFMDYDSHITNCHSEADISGAFDVGGIAGYMDKFGSISYSSASGNVQGSSSTGGLLGYGRIWGTISNCYATGDVIAENYFGGLIGHASETTVTNCYSTGSVTTTLSRMSGGLIGYDAYGSSITTNSYWDIITSGQNSSAAGEGRYTPEMTYPYSNTYINWDFDSIWSHDINFDINSGYPYLRENASSNNSDVLPANSEITLHNYPNPFNPETIISFSIPRDSKVSLFIYNIKGQKIRMLLDRDFETGMHKIVWNGKNNQNKLVGSGVYFYKLNVNGKTEKINKCILLK